MKNRLKVIKVAAGSELDQLLDQAGTQPVLLDRGGIFYRLAREVDADGQPVVTPKAAKRILDETLGSWADLDTDGLIEDVHRWREQGSRLAD